MITAWLAEYTSDYESTDDHLSLQHRMLELDSHVKIWKKYAASRWRCAPALMNQSRVFHPTSRRGIGTLRGKRSGRYWSKLLLTSDASPGVKTLGVDEHIWHHVNPDRRGLRAALSEAGSMVQVSTPPVDG